MIDNILEKPKYLIEKVKNNIIPILFVLFTIFLVVFSNENLTAARKGLMLWANSVVPSLFPFFIATELLSYTNVIYYLEKILTPIMKPLFNVSGSGAYALIMGIISGYPTGAKIVANFREKNICSKEECERLLSFTNNSGPLFIIGTVGVSMFYNVEIGILLFITHLLASLTVGIVFRFWKASKNDSNDSKSKSGYKEYLNKSKINTQSLTSPTFSNLGEIISKSITSAISTMLMIGGFIVLFSVIISMLNNSKILEYLSLFINPIFRVLKIDNKIFSFGLLSGIIELTNGLGIITSIAYKNISVNIIFCAFLLGFGGISVLLQVLGIISKTDISIKPYIIGKFLQGIFASIYTYIFIEFFPLFNLNL